MAKIQGFVKDTNGQPLKDVLISFVGLRNKDRDDVKSSGRGKYVTKDLKSGVYSWVAEKDGYVARQGQIRLPAEAELLENDPIVLEQADPAPDRTERKAGGRKKAAQAQAGSISGIVRDTANRGVSGATVTASSPQNQIFRRETTNASGAYFFLNPPPGEYTVKAQAMGFQDPPAASVTVREGIETANVNFRLTPLVQTGSISGGVTDQTGAAVQGASVKATDVRGKDHGPSITTPIGLSNNVLGNTRFPALFRRYVEIGGSPLLSFDIKAADEGEFFDKTRIAEADELLKELKGLILQIVRSLSKYGTAATKRVNEDWARFESRALEVLQTVARERVAPDRSGQNIWFLLADLTGRNRDTEVAPYVALARHGGKLLNYAMAIYREMKDQLDAFDPEHLRNLFQKEGDSRAFWTEKIKAEASVINRCPLSNWR
jgi:hypothetical protein